MVGIPVDFHSQILSQISRSWNPGLGSPGLELGPLAYLGELPQLSCPFLYSTTTCEYGASSSLIFTPLASLYVASSL